MNADSQSIPPSWKSSTRPARRPYGCLAIAFLLGIVVSVAALMLVVVAAGSDRQALVTPQSSGNDAIVVQLKKTYLSQIIQKNMKNIPTAGLPGQIKNIQVTLVHGATITLSGDDQFDVLGFSITKPFTLTLQPVVSNCKIGVHVQHADLQGIPITNFVASVETQINQQLQQMNLADLPSGFTYCARAVRTEPDEMIVSYSATPQ